MQSNALKLLVAALAIFAGLSLSTPAKADNITWTTWTAGTAGNATGNPATAGSAVGTIGSISVTYSGSIQYLDTNYPSWTPTTSFTNGTTVQNAPLPSQNAVSLNGGSPVNTETITFSSAILNPLFAVWSLGQNGDPTTFDFNQAFTVVAGGPSAEYNGQPITASGNIVTGVEGNGVIQFTGSLTSITFTTPVFEHYYDFTVGAPITAQSTSTIPEPSSLALLSTGLLGVFAAGRRKFLKA